MSIQAAFECPFLVHRVISSCDYCHSPSASEGPKKSISVLLDKCPPWLRGTLGVRSLGLNPAPGPPPNQGEPKQSFFTPSPLPQVEARGEV